MDAVGFQQPERLCYNEHGMDGDTLSGVDLPVADVAFLRKVALDLSILADLGRADLLLCCRTGVGREWNVVAHAKPHSFSALYETCEEDLLRGSLTQVGLLAGLRRGSPNPRVVQTIEVRGATVARQAFPVRNASGRLIAIVVKDAYWLAYERHRRRRKAFQTALSDLTEMVLRGELCGAEALSPFGQRDGIMYVGPDRRIKYMSGIASELYRRLGYRGSLVDRGISEIETIDHQLVAQATSERRCLESQVEQEGLTWVRKAIPVPNPGRRSLTRISLRVSRGRAICAGEGQGVIILIHDATEALRTQREIESKMALIREVHHRVKNNLQVVASIMRLQARRVIGQEAKEALEESINRVLSVAVVHEFLSQNVRGTINVRDVAPRILDQVERGLVGPNKALHLHVTGPDIWLPAEKATQCALLINELVQNAIEHGMSDRSSGSVEVGFVDHGDRVSIVVTDDGNGLPEAFQLDRDANLGLSIVRNMVERDLRGQFQLFSHNQHGTRAVLSFEKSVG